MTGGRLPDEPARPGRRAWRGLDVLDAYQLISQAGEAPVGNVCDPNYTMLAKVGKQYLGSPTAYDSIHARLREAARLYLMESRTGTGGTAPAR